MPDVDVNATSKHNSGAMDGADAYVDVVTVTLNPAIDQTLSIPGFTLGAVNRVASARADAGGKGVNVAAALADFGLRVAVTGFLGQDNDTLFRRLFAEKRIVDDFIRVPGATRTGIKIVDPVADETTDINFPGLIPTQAELDALSATLQRLAASCRWVALAGSVPAGASPTIYRDLMRLAKRQGTARAALDTSGTPLAKALPSGPDLIKPNIAELRELVGQPLKDMPAVLDAARSLAREFGIGTIVVSMGERGALCVEGDAAVLAVPLTVKVASTVGAGDAMVAGFVAGKVRGLELAGCARLATAFAAAAISRVGSGLPARAEIEALARTVRITSLHASKRGNAAIQAQETPEDEVTHVS